MSAAAPLLKISLLLATARGISVGFTPPRPSPEEAERKAFAAANGEALPAVGSYGLVPFKACPPLARAPFASVIAPGGIAAAVGGRLHATPSTVLGATLVCAGAALRSACYRRLGQQFTFELSIQKDHRLVTDGPYAVVRHPGYTALVMQAAGLVVCIAGPGSWWRELAAETLLGKLLGVVVGLLLAVCLACGVDRTYKEDAMLGELFQEQWAEWAQKTRYRMIPYLF
ncbi:hypothetical protein PHLGIDRAFT_32380 [Phlebiopsis gigantea 11061_1 CR5-6]|uniref:Protein-S-isoprenylcysteine O-methyltransferase n=1 Tax=Phlebiopsis gigantea (strain 11061_1 CR5-6) TaxID=745531 RepID=A0A0C3RQB5_PHLG1|nr:hypothetical protein PHLGIDRAFT_32380 [Phlebiopsis gigantea 11061_1 CR5-6]